MLEGELALADGYVVTNKRMHTSVPGVFAAGEIQDNYFRQVATSVGQGTMAAMEAEKFLTELEDKDYAELAGEISGAEPVLA